MDQKLKKAGVAFNENSNDEENITRLDSTLRNTSASKQGIPARIQPIFDLDITAINSRDNISRKELSSILLKRNSSATDLRKRSAMGNSKIDETAEAILGIGQQTDDDGFKEAKNQPEQNMIMLERPTSWSELISRLWNINVLDVFHLSNPDGYFYLLYLKSCFYFFLTLTIISCGVLIPLYSLVHQDSPFPGVQLSWNLSVLDTITLVKVLDDYEVINLTIYIGLLYSLLAYYFVISFCQKMSNFAFAPTTDYINTYASKHAVIIRGVSKKIGTEVASEKIKKVFERRFGKKQVIAVHSYLNCKEPQKIYKRVNLYKKKVDKIKEERSIITLSSQEKDKAISANQSMMNRTSDLIWVGSSGKCNKRQVDALDYYMKKLEDAEMAWQEAKNCYKTSNQGVVIVVFKALDDVQNTFAEIDNPQIKAQLSKRASFSELNIDQWKITEAIPPSDLVWSNLDKIQTQSAFKAFTYVVWPVLLSTVAIFGLLGLEACVNNYMTPTLVPILLYASISFFVFFNIYVVPLLVFNGVQREGHHTKSGREKAYNARLMICLVYNCLACPIMFSIIFGKIFPDFFFRYTSKGENTTIRLGTPRFTQSVGQQDFAISLFASTQNELVGDSIAYIEEFYIRMMIQIAAACIYYQWRVAPNKVLKTFIEMVKVNGKSKLKHFLTDIGLRNAFASLIFCMGLFFSIFVPLMTPLVLCIFGLAYIFDKYNLLYVYPLDFDSQAVNRKTLVIVSLFGIFAFQMALIYTVSTLLTRRIVIYLMVFFVVQVVLLIVAFEFIRKPWDGLVQQIETEMLFERQHNLLGDLTDTDSSFINYDGDNNDTMEVLEIRKRESRLRSRQMKKDILLNIFKDPYAEIFDYIEAKEQDERSYVPPQYNFQESESQPAKYERNSGGSSDNASLPRKEELLKVDLTRIEEEI